MGVLGFHDIDEARFDDPGDRQAAHEAEVRAKEIESIVALGKDD
jgi:hypothetical protein